MNNIKIAQFVLIVTCLAFFASYFYKISSVPFVRLDDGELMQLSETFATQGHIGSQMVDTGHNEHLNYHVHPPFYYIINGLAFKVAGVGILQSRLVPLFSAMAVILLTFLLAGKMLKLPLSLNNFLALTAFFLSTPIFFILSRSNRPEMLALFLILSSILAYSYFVDSRKNSFLLISGLCAGLALTTQAYAGFVVLFLFLSLCFNRLRNWRHIILFLAAFALPLFLYFLWISRDFQSFFYQTFVARKVSSNLGPSSIVERYRHFFSSFEAVATTFFFIVAAALTIFFKPKSKDQQSSASLMQLMLGAICFLSVFIIIPVMNKYYYVILLPFIYLFFIYILNKYQQRIFVVLFSLYLLVNFLGLAIYWQKYKDFDYSAYGQRIIAQLPAPGHFSILASPSLYPALRNYQFYALTNGSIIKPGQTYEGLKARLRQLEVKFIVYQEFNKKMFAELDYLNQFLRSDCVMIAKVQDPYYGSEGVKKNNYIEIYRVK